MNTDTETTTTEEETIQSGYIKFDFGFDSNHGRNINAILTDKMNNLLNAFDFNFDTFFSEIVPHITGCYVSSANMTRQADPKENTAKIPGFFFRFQLDDYAAHRLKNNGIMFKGELFISSNSENSAVNVNDFYLVENYNNAYKYERYYNIDFLYKFPDQCYSKSSKNQLITFDFAKPDNIPYIVDKYKFDEFISNWKNYLSFGEQISLNAIEWHKINIEEETTVYAIKKTSENKNKFRNNIIYSDATNYYIDAENIRLTDVEKYKILTVKVDGHEFGENLEQIKRKIKSFTKLELSIVDQNGANELQKQRENTSNNKAPNYYDSIPVEFVGYDNDENFTLNIFIDANDYENDNNSEKLEKIGENLYLAYESRGDLVLARRGKDVLNKIEKGQVNNPHLIGLIIEPEHFERSVNIHTEENIKFITKLNDSQKKAIIKCLNSNSIFLLQGPPGTGKTQTITELVYQYNKMGKKVLISSQTHIAIDNIYERLPKELDILPVRLVTKQKAKDDNFLPDRLIDNLYNSAYTKYKSKLDNYEQFEQNLHQLKNEYENNFQLFKNNKSNIKKRQAAIKQYHEINSKISDLQNKRYNLENEQIELQYTLNLFNKIVDGLLPLESISENCNCKLLFKKLQELENKYKIINSETFYGLISTFIARTGQERMAHLKELLSKQQEKPQDLIKIENELIKLQNQIDNEKDDNDDKILSLYRQRRALLKEKKNIDENLIKHAKNINININDEKFYFTDPTNIDSKKAINNEIEKAEEFIKDFNKIVESTLTASLKNKTENNLLNIDKELNQIENEIKKNQAAITNAKEITHKIDENIKDINKKLEQYFVSFYTDKLNSAQLPESEEDKFSGIKTYIADEETRFKKFEQNFISLKGIYENLVKYLEPRSEYISTLRTTYNPLLLNHNANVYGFTCTSNQKITSDNGKEDKRHDISQIDFDVVIIDEVSKATPIELLIPIVYGKTVILVGDQRQLPPIFKYRENVFENLTDELQQSLLNDSNITDIISKYRNMVEHSLFEKIFNKLKTNKALITDQYRFHENIMKCVNVFYNEKLSLGGGAEQNNRKQHYLDVNIPMKRGGEFPFFVRNKNTYWLDSDKWADGEIASSSVREGEKSLRNELEVQITTKILEMIEQGYKDLKDNNLEEYKLSAGNGQQPSVAVLSMYGKHIGSLKEELKNKYSKNWRQKFKNIKTEISTVDDYQGKEADIIILNMVTNNKYGVGEFLKKFNRINVAISRSRTMLIIIGSIPFYRDVIINVPNMDDGQKNEIPAYSMICDRCDTQRMHVAGILDISKPDNVFDVQNTIIKTKKVKKHKKGKF